VAYTKDYVVPPNRATNRQPEGGSRRVRLFLRADTRAGRVVPLTASWRDRLAFDRADWDWSLAQETVFGMQGVIKPIW